MCFKDSELKYLGQKAFASYVRSIYVQKDKETFHMEKLPLEEFAASLGLPGAPRIKFLKGDDPKARKNAPRVQMSDSESDAISDLEDEDKSAKKPAAARTKYDRMFERRNQDILGSHRSKLLAADGSDSELDAEVGASDFNGAPIDGDGFLSVKRRIPVDSESDEAPNTAAAAENEDEDGEDERFVQIAGIKTPILVDSKRAEKRLHSKKKLLKYRERGSKLVFDDDGTAHPSYELEDETAFRERGAAEAQRRAFVAEERERVAAHDSTDKALAKEKRMAKRIKRRQREKEERLGNATVSDAAPVAGDAERDLVQDFLDDVKGLYSDEEEAPKKSKKLFEQDGRVADDDEDMDFEGLENMAAELIEG